MYYTYILVGVGIMLLVVTGVGFELVFGIQVVVGMIVGFAGAAASRNLVDGKVSFGRNTLNIDSGIAVVLNNSVST